MHTVFNFRYFCPHLLSYFFKFTKLAFGLHHDELLLVKEIHSHYFHKDHIANLQKLDVYAWWCSQVKDFKICLSPYFQATESLYIGNRHVYKTQLCSIKSLEGSLTQIRRVRNTNLLYWVNLPQYYNQIGSTCWIKNLC